MTTVDAKGIIRYEASDSASPLHTALNLGLNSVSNALNAPGYLTRAGVHTVSGLSGLNTLRTQLDNAGYTGAAYAHRTDLGELWYHSGTGGSWGVYRPVSEWEQVNVPLASPFTNNTCIVSRNRNNNMATITFSGASGTPSGGVQSAIGQIPVGYRPVSTVKFFVGSSGSGNANGRLIGIASDGTINITASGTLWGSSSAGGSGLMGGTVYQRSLT